VADSNTRKTSNLLKIGAIVVVIATLIFIAKKFNFQELLIQALNWISSLGIWGVFAFISIYAIATVLFIPGSLLTLGAGVLFGVVFGSIYVSLGSIIGATLAFLIGRYFAKDWVDKKLETQPKFKAVDRAISKEGWKIVGLLRLAPIFPFILLNYGLGVTQVSLKDYFFASWIGMIPGTIMYVYLGSLAGNLATLGSSSQQSSPVQWIIRIIGLLATVAVTVYVTKVAQKALSSQIDE
jgi:uncharacterized membrane protein YdjX (TVP38/TMEM64 family)